jgi:uncharacterized oligopeptide transporter (OPT) family protein
MGYGALAGLVAAEVFLVGISVVSIALGQLTAALVAMLFGQVYGVLPAVIIGGFSGLVIGACLAYVPNQLSGRQAAVAGIVIAAAMLLSLVVWLISRQDPLSIQSRPDAIGAVVFLTPIIALYLISGGWVGWKLSLGGHLETHIAKSN